MGSTLSACAPGRGAPAPYYTILGRSRALDDNPLVTCPYCGEQLEIYLEPDVTGRLVQDCEVCCNPWLLHVVRDGGGRRVDVSRADGSD